MTEGTEKGFPQHYSMGRVYLNAVAAVLSILLAFLLLLDHVEFLLYYFLFTIIIAAIAFTLKIRLLSLRMPEPIEEDISEVRTWTQRWKVPLLIFALTIAVFVLPLSLAWALDPYIWFVLMVGFITGLSVSEILFYLYTRSAIKKLRMRSQTAPALV